jgi:hypothetical protein
MVRVRRAIRFESEAITGALHPERRSKSRLDEQLEEHLAELGTNTSIVDPGFQSQLNNETVGSLVEALGRYETLHERRLFRAIQELERLQTVRRTKALLERPAALTPTATS